MPNTDEIKELAELICVDCTECDDCEWGRGKCECVLREARMLYNEGYRKIKQAKWIWINQAEDYFEPPYGDTCKCSACEYEIDVSETCYRYCPMCGAKITED